MKYKKPLKILLSLILVCTMIMDVTLVSAAATTSTNLLSSESEYSLTTDKTEYLVGEPINVTAHAPSGRNAWVGIVKSGRTFTAADGPSYYWAYVPSGGDEFNLMAPQNEVYDEHYANLPADEQALIDLKKHQLMPGEYDVVLFRDGGYSVVERKTITIDAEYDITYMHGDEPLTGLTPTVYRHSKAKNAAITLPKNVAKEGYTFVAWYETAELKGNPVTSIAKGSSGDKTYYAKFNTFSYEVTFDTDGGNVVEKQTVSHDQYVTRPADPEKDGFVFLDWVTAKNGTTPFDFSKPITGNVTVYAAWVAEGAKLVQFETGGGSAVLTQSVMPGNKAVKPENPKRQHYTFDKWVTAKDGDQEFNFNTVIEADTTIYAKWKPVNYQITFDANGGSAVSKKTYTIETSSFTLPTSTREGYAFKGWKDANGKSYTTIEKGTAGNLSLTAQWERQTSLLVSGTTHYAGDPIYVDAYCESDGAWVGLYGKNDTPGVAEAINWYYVDEYLGEKVNLAKMNSIDRAITPGEYKIILYGDPSYNVILKTVNITMQKHPNPTKGDLKISGYSRSDKAYNGVAESERQRTLYDYFYGDAITVEATLSGSNTEGAWIGILGDVDYSIGRTSGFIGTNWFYVEDFAGQKVNLNYVTESVLSADATPIAFALNYWIVLVSGNGTILDAEPINYRTFNMDWSGKTWGPAVSSRLLVETEWSSKNANGENQMPGVTIRQINGHFGLKKDNTGKLVEITEELLAEGKDYTLEYPAQAKNPGTYNIKVNFPSSGGTYNYLSTDPSTYGLKDGIPFYLTSSANEYAITYHLNGGVNHDDNPSFYKTGSEIVLKSPTRSDYVFAGWYTTHDFKEGTQIEKISANSASDIALYAKWINETEATYKIAYVLNGGENNLNNPTGYTGVVDVNLKAARKAGYTFDGWFLDAAFTKAANVLPKGMTGDVTLYAKFTKGETKDKVRVDTSVKGGSITGDVYGNAGDTVTITYKPSNDYKLDSVVVDGVNMDITKYPSSYTFENVTGDHHIDVVFKLQLAQTKMKNLVTGNGKIQVSWNSVKRAKEYKVYRSADGGKTYKTIATTSELRYIDTKVNPGKKYSYKVAAVAGDIIGKTSAAKSIKASKALTRAKITSIAGKNGKVTLKWKKVTGADCYKVYRSTDGGKTYKFVTSALCPME